VPGLCLYELLNYRHQMSRDLYVLSGMISAEQGAGREISDPEVVREVNSWASQQRSIVLACVYGKTGQLLIKYSATTTSTGRCQHVGDDIDRIEDGYLVLYQPILHQGRKPVPSLSARPALVLRAPDGDFRIVAIILLSSWLVALLLASRLHA